MDPLAILSIIFSAGAAFGGAKAALNGTRKNVVEIKEDVKEIKRDVVAHSERLAVVETIVERRTG